MILWKGGFFLKKKNDDFKESSAIPDLCTKKDLEKIKKIKITWRSQERSERIDSETVLPILSVSK